MTYRENRRKRQMIPTSIETVTESLMRVGILTPTQSLDSPVVRHTSKSGKESMIRRGQCVKVYDQHGQEMKTLIREKCAGSAPPTDVTRFVRGRYAVPTINKPGLPEILLLQYPLPDQSSYRTEHRRKIWGYKMQTRIWDEDILCEIAARTADAEARQLVGMTKAI